MSFPIARKLLAFARRARRNWLTRHQNSFNFWIHMLGIPIAVAGIPLLFVAEWYWGVGALVVGYLLQWIGHRVEGVTYENGRAASCRQNLGPEREKLIDLAANRKLFFGTLARCQAHARS